MTMSPHTLLLDTGLITLIQAFWYT